MSEGLDDRASLAAQLAAAETARHEAMARRFGHYKSEDEETFDWLAEEQYHENELSRLIRRAIDAGFNESEIIGALNLLAPGTATHWRRAAKQAFDLAENVPWGSPGYVEPKLQMERAFPTHKGFLTWTKARLRRRLTKGPYSWQTTARPPGLREGKEG